MKVFIYQVGDGGDANINMIFAETTARADELYCEEEGLDGPDDPDFEDVSRTEYTPTTEQSFVLFCG